MSMNHFTIEDWTDYVRGLANPELRELMDAHRAAGCIRCDKRIDTLARLSVVAHNEKTIDVPDYLVRSALALFASQSSNFGARRASILASMVFDSFMQPLAAGVRSQQRVSRQVLYQADGYSLDLRIEQERDGSQLFVVGQVFDRSRPQTPIANVPVLLLSGPRLLQRVDSNDFGEFHLQYEPTSPLSLHLPIPETMTNIEVNLAAFSQGEEHSGSHQVIR
jgi:hypothetical protein